MRGILGRIFNRFYHHCGRPLSIVRILRVILLTYLAHISTKYLRLSHFCTKHLLLMCEECLVILQYLWIHEGIINDEICSGMVGSQIYCFVADVSETSGFGTSFEIATRLDTSAQIKEVTVGRFYVERFRYIAIRASSRKRLSEYWALRSTFSIKPKLTAA